MLTTNKKVLDAADRGGYAVGAFNVNNMEFVQAIAKAAELEKSPAIIATTEGAIDYAGLDYLACLIKNAGNAKVPLTMHLDHGKDLNVIRNCLKIGYTSVMIDGSHYPYNQNVAVTKKVVAMAHKKRVSVEAELGTIGGVEDKVSSRVILMTDPDVAANFVRQTRVDCLAVAIGTSHGAYKFAGSSKLDFKRLKEIKDVVDVPLVLHGASGIPEDIVKKAVKYGAKLGHPHGVSNGNIKRAVKLGINKINIDSDLRLSFDAGIRKVIKKQPDVFDPRKILGAGRDIVIDTVRKKMRLFGSSGKG